jgi:predicted dehydrogenase
MIGAGPGRIRAVLVGAGKVGAGYALDPIMAKSYPFASHAQVLAAHPSIDWGAVVDPSDEALATVKRHWNVLRMGRAVEVTCADWHPELAILATPPSERLRALDALPSLRAIIVEKPLGTTLRDASAFIATCRERSLLVQVNLQRRADDRLRDVAARLSALVGTPQSVFGLYGNGLRNNGTHMVDLCRMLFGEVARTSAIASAVVPANGPIPGDIHVPFRLEHESGVAVQFSPLDFRSYRENAVDIWGTAARLSILQEGLYLARSPRRPNRGQTNEHEIASDVAEVLESTIGHAFYRMYDNLLAAMRGEETLVSPAESALQTEAAVEAVWRSAHEGGVVVVPERAA